MREAYRKHFGKEGDEVLVWQGPTRAMNPAVPESYIARHMADDPARAAAEYGAQFRVDLEAFVLREAVMACVSSGCYERGPLGEHTYVAFCDPSGGSSDSMTLAIAHLEGAVAVVDLAREVKPPFSPEAVVAEFAAALKSYNLFTVTGDRYAGAWPAEAFSRFNITYTPADKNKSDIYGALLPLINSRRIDLVDNQKLINQLLSLERRVARGGRDSIDHPQGQHDDLANAVAGAAVLAVTAGTYDASYSWAVDDRPQTDMDAWVDRVMWQRERLGWFLHRAAGMPLWD